MQAAEVDFGELSEEEQIRLALQMSMGAMAPVDDVPPAAPSFATPAHGTASAAADTSVDLAAMLSNPSVLSDLLSGLPGVDPNDEQIKAMLAALVRLHAYTFAYVFIHF